MKTLLAIFAILVIALIIVLAIGFPNTSTSLRQNVDISAIAWELPQPTEKGQINKSFLLSDIDSCKKYHVKQVSKHRFIVACPVGSGWIFYNVFTDQKRAFVADETTLANLTPPVHTEIKSSPKDREKYTLPERKVFIRDAR